MKHYRTMPGYEGQTLKLTKQKLKLLSLFISIKAGKKKKKKREYVVQGF